MIQSRPIFRFISVVGLFLAATVLLSSCVEDNSNAGYVERPVDEIYDNALDSLKAEGL